MQRLTYLFIFCFSLFLSILYYIYNPFRIIPVEYDVAVGQIADKDIIAPFDFEVFKTEDTLRREQQLVQETVAPIYHVSEVLTFNALKNLDFIFEPFMNQKNFQSIRNTLYSNNFNLSQDTIFLLMNDNIRNSLYRYLSDRLAHVFQIGVLHDTYPNDTINVKRDNEIINYEIPRLFLLSEAKNRILSTAPTGTPENALEELIDLLLIHNIVIDVELTNLEQRRARDSVVTTSGKVPKNDVIVSKGERVTVEHKRKLDSLIMYQSEMDINYGRNQIFLSALGFFILSFILLIFFHQIHNQFFKKELTDIKEYIVLYGFLFIPIFFTILFHHYIEISSLLIPYTLSILVITFIFQAETGFIFNILLMLYIAFFLNWAMAFPFILSFTNVSAILSIKKLKYKQHEFFLAFLLIVTTIIINLAFSFVRNESSTIFLRNSLYSIISIVISVILASMLLTSIQKKLNISSKKNLFALTDFDHPLLRRMQKVTPGTYHHSIIVGNLAESAAEAIGADHLLARVGSYFHDIGKMENSKFFIENDFKSSEFHNQLIPFESAKIIKNHVSDGVNLAMKENLPKNVIAIIEQHHGTSLIRYFYHKAKENNLIIDEQDFSYEGPKPHTKEAAIVMIADIIESTTKSLNEISEDILQKVLDDTVSRLISEEQLNNAPITLQELEIVKKSMAPILLGIYRKRIEYPE